ncbi:septum formation inhibitor Maf [Mycoplasmatota bacterium]|nr:septum formation inhibitor Maf [Mycoplasmatota bacterium]
MNIILASNSPRRRELLQYITNDFTVVVSHVDETYDKNLLPQEIVLYLSKLKAQAVSQNHPQDLIIGCDTIVCLEDKILEKPVNEDDAYKMLKRLSGKTHQVITGVTLIHSTEIESFYTSTDVAFYDLNDEEINDYIKTKEPFDKAGAYGIQGYASKFVKEIKGDYFTVVGLPVGTLYQRLKKIT